MNELNGPSKMLETVKSNEVISLISAPLRILNEAIKSVPAVKYALGVAGLVAVVAIVLYLKVSLPIATFGATVVLVFMVMLFIFAKATRAREHTLAPAITILIYFCELAFICVVVILFTSAIWNTPFVFRNYINNLATNRNQSSIPSETKVLLAGTVVDQNDIPIQGSQVTIEEIPGMAPVETSSDGVFRIQDIPKNYGDEVRIRVIKEGYQPNPYTQDVVLGKVPPKVRLTKKK